METINAQQSIVEERIMNTHDCSEISPIEHVRSEMELLRQRVEKNTPGVCKVEVRRGDLSDIRIQLTVAIPHYAEPETVKGAVNRLLHDSMDRLLTGET